MYTATKEQIEQWQKIYGKGNIRRFIAKEHGKSAYCRKPTRKEMSFLSQQHKDPMAFNALLLKTCWIDGDKEIQTDDNIFLGLSSEITELLEFAQIEVEKY